MARKSNDPETDGIATTDPPPMTTRLDTDVTKPSTVQPGDAPADTMDPTERASTVGGDKAAAALAGHLTVNAVIPIPEPAALRATDDEDRASNRVETYPAVRPDGTIVTVEHNIDTGASKVK